MRIYVDLVAILNFLVDFFLILATNRISGFPPGCRRSALAAAFGGLYGGICLLPGFSFLGNLFWRAVSLCLIAVLAFGFNRSAVQRGSVFVLLSMALGGIAMGLGQGSVWMLILAVLLTWLLCGISFRGSVGQRAYIPVTLRWQDQEISVIALKDTGNTLHDPITGEQVLIAGADVARKLLGLGEEQLEHPVELLASGQLPGMRLIPYQAVGQPGAMLAAVRFRDAKIGNQWAQPLVAFAPQELARGEMYQMLTGGAV